MRQMLKCLFKLFLIYFLLAGAGSLAVGSELRLKISRDFKWGFMNGRGEIIIEPIYEEIRDFHKGLAAVKIDGRWGYIDINGDFVIEPVWEKVDDFRISMARVTIDGKTGLVDSTGRYVLAARYDDIHYFQDEGRIAVELEGKSGLVDRAGKSIVEPQFDSVYNISKFGAVVCNGKGERQCGFITADGRIAIPPKYSDITYD